MKYINKKNLSKFVINLLMVCCGVTLVACGISLFYALNIGSDPISVFVDGQHRIFGVSYGIINLMNSIVYLAFIFLFSRKQIRLATLISGVGLGPLINLFTELLSRWITPKGSFTLQWIWGKGMVVIPPNGDYILRFALLFPAVVLLGFGLGLYLSANMGASPVDAVVIFISEKLDRPLKKVKVGFDFSVALLGFLLGGVTGMGTIIGIILTGPMIAYSIKIIDSWKKKSSSPDKNIKFVKENEGQAMA